MIQNTATKVAVMAIVLVFGAVDAARVEYRNRAEWEAAVAALNVGRADFNHLNPPPGGRVQIPQDVDFDGGDGLTLFHYGEHPDARGGVIYVAGDVTTGSNGVVAIDDTTYIRASLDGTPDRLLKLKFPREVVAWGMDWALPSLTDTCLGIKFGDDPFFSFGGLSKPGSGFLGYIYTEDSESATEVTLRDDCASHIFLNFDNVAWASPATGRSGAGMGDPHFLTWGQQWYDFHGICDLVFLSAPSFAGGLGLDIHIRTKARHQYSYIEAAVIKIGDDILEVGSWGEHWFNGVENGVERAEFAFMGGSFPITYTEAKKSDKSIKNTFAIALDDASDESIVITNFKDMVAVKVQNAASAGFETSQGLMGKFMDGTLLARDGASVVEDHDLFGQEWQVLDSEPQLFQSPSPSVGKACLAPPVPEASQLRRRLSEETISVDAAEEACAQHHQEGSDAQEMCVFDVIAMGDLEVATGMAGAY